MLKVFDFFRIKSKDFNLEHRETINNISNNISEFPDNIKITLIRNNSCCFREEYKKHTIQINLMSLNKILEVNTNEDLKYVVAEPDVTMEQITDYLLNLKQGSYMLQVTPEFKHITIGGAVNGLGIESSSCKYGLFEKTIFKYEVLLTDGSVIEATANNQYKDLFYALPGSYGTFGLITKIYLYIVPAGKYVRTNYRVLENTKNIKNEFKQRIESKNCEFMEGLVMEEKVLLSYSNCVNYISLYQWLFNTSRFNYSWSKWYYNHIIDITDKHTNYLEFIPIKDYLFRWDRGAFWFASNRMKCNWYNRIMYGSELTSKKLYQRAKKKNIYNREKEKIVQDLLVPLDNMCDFTNSIKEICNVFPLWLCPIKTFSGEDNIFSLPSKDDIYVDVGVYGSWEENKNLNSNKPDFLIKNKEIENKLYHNDGLKFLCNMNYYDEKSFWNIYDKKKYDEIKNKYDKGNKLLNIYEKVCSFYIKNDK